MYMEASLYYLAQSSAQQMAFEPEMYRRKFKKQFKPGLVAQAEAEFKVGPSGLQSEIKASLNNLVRPSLISKTRYGDVSQQLACVRLWFHRGGGHMDGQWTHPRTKQNKTKHLAI